MVEAARSDQKPVIEPVRLGMITFIGSEAIFFALLITAFIYFGGGRNSGQAGIAALEPFKALIFTIFLLSSSLTMWLADRSLARRDRRMQVIWLLATIFLGAVFLIGQGSEYLHLFSEEITLNRNLFGTTFFTLTGFHGAHVLGGLIMLSILAGFSIAGYYKGSRSVAFDAISLYWHFVDVVWIFIFSIIYIGALLVP